MGSTLYSRSASIRGFDSQRLKRRTVLCANGAHSSSAIHPLVSSPATIHASVDRGRRSRQGACFNRINNVSYKTEGWGMAKASFGMSSDA